MNRLTHHLSLAGCLAALLIPWPGSAGVPSPAPSPSAAPSAGSVRIVARDTGGVQVASATYRLPSAAAGRDESQLRAYAVNRLLLTRWAFAFDREPLGPGDDWYRRYQAMGPVSGSYLESCYLGRTCSVSITR